MNSSQALTKKGDVASLTASPMTNRSFSRSLWASGQKSLLAFSRPFSLARYAPSRWVTTADDLHWLMEALDASPHEPVAPKHIRQRRSTKLEIVAQNMVEWEKPRGRKAPRRAKL